jgi:hypothetical protein
MMVSATYTLKVPTPTFSVPAGTYNSPQSVLINPPGGGCVGSGACGLSVTRPEDDSAPAIWYTIDGSTPAPGGLTSTQYAGGPITVSTTETIKAIGVQTGWDNSSVASAKYTIH